MAGIPYIPFAAEAAFFVGVRGDTPVDYHAMNAMNECLSRGLKAFYYSISKDGTRLSFLYRSPSRSRFFFKNWEILTAFHSFLELVETVC